MEVKLRERMAARREQRIEKINMLRLAVQEHMAGRRETSAAERAGAAATAADLRAEKAAQAAERRAWIMAGFDPETGKGLPTAGGKYSGRVNPALRWTTIDQLGDNLRDTVGKHTKRDAMGNPTGFDKPALRTALINGEVPPPEEWRSSPERYMEWLVTLKDPDNPNKLLFPADRKSGRSPFDRALIEAVKRWFPDYTP
jgi:hypothetical protein